MYLDLQCLGWDENEQWPRRLAQEIATESIGIYKFHACVDRFNVSYVLLAAR
jgi:hypothetical protein